MEYCTNNDHMAFFEDLLALRSDILHDYNAIINDSFDAFLPPSTALFPSPFDDHSPLSSALSPPDFAADSSAVSGHALSNYGAAAQQECHYYCSVAPSVRVGDGAGLLGNGAPCKPEPGPGSEAPVPAPRKKAKKVTGQPSKNLMAERRRRKRLNDRLSMLRSVVPKISKMDRTSILGDTIDYMKELVERINSLQEDVDLGSSSNQVTSMGILKDVKASEVVVRNSPKFDVERRDEDTRIEICCGGKPGLLLSTVTTLEALGLEIHQCVISCFNDFALQASCSEEMSKKTMLDVEDIKQALLRSAGYGGRCL